MVKKVIKKIITRVNIRAGLAVVGLVCVGVGIGVVWHWGAGLAVGGLGLWIDAQFGK